MEDIGKVSEDEMAYIEEWNRNPGTNPQAAMAILQAEGQAKAIMEGNPAVVAASEAVNSNAAMPDMAGENQFTTPRVDAGRPGAANPVSQNPV